MSAAAGGRTPLREDELVERDGIWHRRGEEAQSDYRRRWEDEAETDHVRSAIAGGATGRLDYGTLTAKVAPVWDRVPKGQDLGTVLEIGAGYGRIPLYLANERRVTWSAYCAVDISEAMLRRFVEYQERFVPAATGTLYPMCASADALPLEDDSVDTVLTSAVFLHMGKRFVAAALAELARVLRPGGSFLFDVSFPNARNPANLLPQLKPRRLRAPNFMKYWRRGEVEQLLESSGLAAKAGGYAVEPGAYAILPKHVGPVSVPLARRVNGAAERTPERLRDLVTASFTVVSPRLLA